MDESKPIYKKIAVALVVIVAYSSMRAMGLSFGDLWEMVQEKIDSTRAETREYRETTYSERVSREMRDAAAKMPDGNPNATGIDGDLNNELAAERKRVMEQAASTAAQNRARMLKGDTETLKKQVRNNVRDAGGDN